MHACIIHTYVRTYVHTYIHTYLHTYIHIYIHTCIPTHITLHHIQIHINNKKLLATDYACYSCIFLMPFPWKPIVHTYNGENSLCSRLRHQ